MLFAEVTVAILDFNCISYHTFCWQFHFSLIECQQCNTFGTIGFHERDGLDCCKCKPGYTGNECESCESEDLIVSGTNGFVDDNGQGVKCSKS